MATTIRFFDGHMLTSRYNGHFVVHVDPFVWASGINEFDLVVPIPGDPDGRLVLFYVGTTDPYAPNLPAGFTFDSAAPPAWADYWDIRTWFPPWDEPGDDVAIYDQDWNEFDGGFAVATDAASDPDWYLPPGPPTITGLSTLEACEHETIDIFGTNFVEVYDGVLFNGAAPYAITVVDSTHIRAVVPAAQAGPIHLFTYGGEVFSADTFVSTPSVVELDHLADISDGTDLRSSTVGQLDVCALSDTLLLFAYAHNFGGRIKALTVAGGSIAAGAGTVIDLGALDPSLPASVSLVRLSDTKAIVVWVTSSTGVLGGPSVVRAAVATVAGGVVTLGVAIDLPPTYAGRAPLCAMTATRVLVGDMAFFSVAGTTLTYTETGPGNVLDTLTRLSDTQALATYHLGSVIIGGVFYSRQFGLRVTDFTADVFTYGASTVIPTNTNIPQRHGWVTPAALLGSGPVWMPIAGDGRWAVTPHGMATPDASLVLDDFLDDGSFVPTLVSLFEDLTTHVARDDLIVGVAPGMALALDPYDPASLPGYHYGSNTYKVHSPLVIPAWYINDEPLLRGLGSGRSVLVTRNASTGVAEARLLEPDICPPLLTGWHWGSIPW